MAPGKLPINPEIFFLGFLHTWSTISGSIGVCCALVFYIGILALMNLLPFAMIIIGSLNIHNCPTEKYIPIYLIVSGILSLIWINHAAFKNFKKYQKKKSEDTSESTRNPCLTTLQCMVTFFGFCWFVAGNVWVFLAYEPNYEKGAADYCDKLTYKVAFWSVVLTYLIPIAFCCLCCCIGVCFGMSAMSELSTENQSEEDGNKPTANVETTDTGHTSNTADNTGSSIYPDLSDMNGETKPAS